LVDESACRELNSVVFAAIPKLAVVGTVGAGFAVAALKARVDAAIARSASVAPKVIEHERRRVERRSIDWIKIKNPNAPAATRIMEW
jgi:hypothetical protein